MNSFDENSLAEEIEKLGKIYLLHIKCKFYLKMQTSLNLFFFSRRWHKFSKILLFKL